MMISQNFQNLHKKSRQNQNFDGKFYAVTDAHGRTIKTAGILSAIEKKCQDKVPATLIDGGDFTMGAYSTSAITAVYSKFAQANPHIRTIFNLGNCELFDFKATGQRYEAFVNYTKQLADSGIELINASINSLAKKYNNPIGQIKPYTIVEDIVDGEKKKVLITGVTSANDNKVITLGQQKAALRKVLMPAIKQHQPDKIVVISHNYLNDTKKLLQYIKKTLKIKNIELVIGGHPHSLIDTRSGKTRILYPPAQSKGALEIELTPKGFEFSKMKPKKDKYDYSALDAPHEGIIKNHIIGQDIEINPIYKEIMDAQEPIDMWEDITKAATTLGYRKAGKNASETCALGTFLTNQMRDKTKSDFAILLTMDFREQLPSKGKRIIRYNIKDCLNANKPIYIVDVSAKQLVEIFKLSLKKQNQKDANRDFFEFSDNIKIQRYVGNQRSKIKQICIKDENNNWHELIDEKTKKIKKEFQDKKFKLATCSYVALGQRDSLKLFKKFNATPFFNQGQEMKTETLFIDSLKEIASTPNFSLKRSEIKDIIA